MTGEAADIALLACVLNGDQTGLAVLMDRHWTSLVRFSRSILGDRDAAEDVAQEVFVRLWEFRETWGLKGSVRGLLFRMTRNLSLDENRQRETRQRAANNAPEPARASCPARSIETNEIGNAIQTALARLPERRREVFVLVREYGLSYREAADALGITPQTVANHLQMALADLREALTPHLPVRGEVSLRLGPRAHVRYAGGAIGQ